MTNGEDRIDALVDEVARRMTEGAPAADFTARVLQRIEDRQPQLRWRWVWVAVPIAAAAMVLIVMQVVRLPPSRATRASASPAEAFGTGGKPSVDASRSGPDLVERPDPVGVRPPITKLKRSVAEDRSSPSIDALAPPRLDVTPLDVTPLEALGTSPDPIEVEHLETIAPIAVTPLGDSSRRF